jgi:PAS domain S-box-containing protein
MPDNSENIELFDDRLHFNQLIENINEVFCLIDKRSKKIIYLSQTFEELFGISVKSILNNPEIIETIIDPEDNSRIIIALERLYSLNDPFAEEFKIVRPDGTQRWVWGRINPIKDDFGNTYRFAGIAEDITQRRLAEDELRKAITKAEEADKLKTAFLANISHEIRTPLNGILGFSELLCNDELTPEKKTYYIDVISKSSQQLLGIVDDILDLSKLETGQLKLMPEQFLLTPFITELSISFQHSAELKDLSFRLVDDVKINTSVLADKRRLQQVLSILYQNALKFTPAGNIYLGFSPKNGYIEFYIKDTGIGIKKDFQDRIFGRFQQEDYDASRIYGGTGVGLSLAKSFVELMGGRIWFTSEPEHGSTFYFTIPVAETVITNIIETNISQQDNKFEPCSKLTILVAEDENLNYLFYEEIFEKTNINLIRAYDGSEAIKKCEAHPEICLILMDIKMPIMNGLEATRKIRIKHPNIPIIAVTAFAMDNDKQNALTAGCNDYLSKPLKPDEFLEFLRKYLNILAL